MTENFKLVKEIYLAYIYLANIDSFDVQLLLFNCSLSHYTLNLV